MESTGVTDEVGVGYGTGVGVGGDEILGACGWGDGDKSVIFGLR